MTVLELHAKREQLARNILSLENEIIINELSRLYEDLTIQFPCQHTEEEIIRSAREAIAAYEAGKCIPHETIKKRFTL